MRLILNNMGSMLKKIGLISAVGVGVLCLHGCDSSKTTTFYVQDMGKRMKLL